MKIDIEIECAKRDIFLSSKEIYTSIETKLMRNLRIGYLKKMQHSDCLNMKHFCMFSNMEHDMPEYKTGSQLSQFILLWQTDSLFCILAQHAPY